MYICVCIYSIYMYIFVCIYICKYIKYIIHIYKYLNLYTFKSNRKQFFLKTKMTCYCRNLIYVVICSTCKKV